MTDKGYKDISFATMVAMLNSTQVIHFQSTVENVDKYTKLFMKLMMQELIKKTKE